MLNETYLFKKVMREITPLTANDCFSIFSRRKKEFTFPLHTHEEMELNLILGGAGTQRIIGDHMGDITDAELVLVGSNLPHGWFTNGSGDKEILEVTIQFNRELFSQNFLEKNQLLPIRKLFENAKRGILFSPEVIASVAPHIIALEKKNGFDSFLQLLSLLHELSIAQNSRYLSDPSFSKEIMSYDSSRLETAFDYMNRKYGSPITLTDIARVANMSEAAFSRFIKTHTGYTFTENLTEIRFGHVTRLLISTQQSIAEIAYKCGFNNMANFNKLFKRRKGCTPKEFKGNFNRERVLV